MNELSPAEWERYARHLRLAQIGPQGQLKLQRSRVLIIGVGGLGSVTAAHLAAAGIGTLGLIEFDEVTVSNLHRQLLYRDQDVGKPKLWAAKRQLESLNPHIRVVAHEGPLDAANAGRLIDRYDLVLDGSDNFETRYLVNDACYFAHKPLISASVTQFDGQLSTFIRGEGPCYRCLFPEGAGGGCAAEGVVGPAVGVMGGLQAMEALKLLLAIGKPTTGRLITYEALQPELSDWAIARNPDCPLCGDTPSITSLEGGLVEEDDWEMDVREFEKRRQTLTVLDVRDQQLGQQLDGAIHLPFSQLASHLHQLDPDGNYVLVCQSGQLSRQAVQTLRASGLRAWNLRGGIKA